MNRLAVIAALAMTSCPQAQAETAPETYRRAHDAALRDADCYDMRDEGFREATVCRNAELLCIFAARGGVWCQPR